MATNHVERAYRAWPILIRRAKAKRTIEYGALAEKLGIHWRPVGNILGVIQDYCLDEKLPPLTILVVNKGEGTPGVGFVAWDVDDLETGRKMVFDFNWSLLPNPFSYAQNGDTELSLARRLVKAPQSSAEIYSKIKVRGYAQIIFRKALLMTYESGCAFCGMTFEEALDAAHIIPWSTASASQRLNPSNGLLLCSTHHGLFDAGLMTVDRTNRIRYFDPDAKKCVYTNADRRLTIDLHRQRAFMPKDSKYWPSEQSLIYLETKVAWGDLG